MVSLGQSKVLDEGLRQLFVNPATTVIGFGFSSDLHMFRRHIPEMTWYSYMENFVDAQLLYSRVYKDKNQIALSKVVKQCTGINMCKGEQMSNWERRPLRLSQ